MSSAIRGTIESGSSTIAGGSVRAAVRLSAWLLVAIVVDAGAEQVDIQGPSGSAAFGEKVYFLSNGNMVVTDPRARSNRGAVHLYDPNNVLISTLTGTNAGDEVGSGGVTVLDNGNFVVGSPGWDNGAAENAGAATWVDGTTGLSGEVSAANSLIGTTAGDAVSNRGVVQLANSNYVVRSASWDNDGTLDTGAVTWASGNTGLAGVVNIDNSLVGISANDNVGNDVVALTNGNYVVQSASWDNGGTLNAGAATWASGNTGVAGVVNIDNSLVGISANDGVGVDVVALTNGNYVVRSSNWDNGGTLNAGAVTWGDGSTGTTGAVTPVNSLVGSSAGDQVGLSGVIALSNGSYVAGSPQWRNSTAAGAGAATWGSGDAGISGPVSTANSLVGTAAFNFVGRKVFPLVNGNYVVASPEWDNGAVANVGAATFGNGDTGTTGAVLISNSLTGTISGDAVGDIIVALSNGNYAVSSPLWNNGATADVGAVTWADGTTGRVGAVSPANSLIGGSPLDRVGQRVVALANANYVVGSPFWRNGASVAAGAASFLDGSAEFAGVVSTSNSLVGSTSGDLVGLEIAALTNGNYVVSSPQWANGAFAAAGAATWADGTTGLTGTISLANSLLGTAAGDRISSGGIQALDLGGYVFVTPEFDGPASDTGAVTLARGDIGLAGTINADNSVLGTIPNAGQTLVYDYFPGRQSLAVGRAPSNIVTIFTQLRAIGLFSDGFE